MNDNPYVSPTELVHASGASQVMPVGERRFGPWTMAGLGLLIGPCWGAICGAIAAGILGVATGFAEGGVQHIWRSDGVAVNEPPALFLALIGAWIGAWTGGISGAPIGLIVGAIVGLSQRTHWHRLRRLAAGFSALGGGLLGLLGGFVVSGAGGKNASLSSWALIATGVLCGVIAGALGGSGMGLMLARLGWGPPVVDVDSTADKDDTSKE